MAAAAEEKEITTDFTWETTELLRHKRFAFCRFRLDTLHAPPLLPETADFKELSRTTKAAVGRPFDTPCWNDRSVKYSRGS